VICNEKIKFEKLLELGKKVGARPNKGPPRSTSLKLIYSHNTNVLYREPNSCYQAMLCTRNRDRPSPRMSSSHTVKIPLG